MFPRVHVSGAVSTKSDIRQGCILALLLFNLYIKPVIQALSSSNHHSPMLRNHAIPALLYADDLVILSISQVGMRRVLGYWLPFA